MDRAAFGFFSYRSIELFLQPSVAQTEDEGSARRFRSFRQLPDHGQEAIRDEFQAGVGLSAYDITLAHLRRKTRLQRIDIL